MFPSDSERDDDLACYGLQPYSFEPEYTEDEIQKRKFECGSQQTELYVQMMVQFLSQSVVCQQKFNWMKNLKAKNASQKLTFYKHYIFKQKCMRDDSDLTIIGYKHKMSLTKYTYF